MRNRYYSPILRRFVNADVLHGKISDSTSLNRYAYVNGNPVMYVDPLGLSAERLGINKKERELVTVDRYIKLHAYNAIYVSDYSVFPGVGHAVLFLKTEDGQWIKTEYIGVGYDKSTAEVKTDEIGEDELFAYLNQKLEWKSISIPTLQLVNFQDTAMLVPQIGEDVELSYKSEGVQYVAFNGEYSDSIELAQRYDDTGEYPKYHLLENNCLHYVKEILGEGFAENPMLDHYIKNTGQIIPSEFHKAVEFIS